MAIIESAPWSIEDALETYGVRRWGEGYFSINAAGHLCVHSDPEDGRSIDVRDLVDRLQQRGIEMPVLIRFGDVLRHRLQSLHEAFAKARDEYAYQGEYFCVYPIKVNQQRQVVEEVLEFGRPFQFGLEAGSKPELLAVIALADNDTPIVCNGFKDSEYIEMVMLAEKIGRRITLVVEKFSELDLALEAAQRLQARPSLGFRIKLASPGSGRWQNCGGSRSKFGLTVSEVLLALEKLQSLGMADCFKLLHFHLGSQITNIRNIKTAVNEAARVYVELHQAGAGLQYLDVGGGLGIDYQGSRTSTESSVNYTLGQYARDVVYHIQAVCDEANVPHPTIVSESGRAATAFHSLLVSNVLGVSESGARESIPEVPEDAEPPLLDLASTYKELKLENVLESYNDAQQALEMATSLFHGGHLGLADRGLAENLYWGILRRIHELVARLDFVPEDLWVLDDMLADIYFCNFSLFQSLPDSWAIEQIFPVMPIQRLDEPPTQRGILADITCDSDGKIDRFVHGHDMHRTLPLHPQTEGDYCLAFLLIGAYQEILGDMHNLFGDTHAVHVSLDESGDVVIDNIVKGDTVQQVLEYVEFDVAGMMARLRASVETAVRKSRIDDRQAGDLLRFYESGIHGYTYLEGNGTISSV